MRVVPRISQRTLAEMIGTTRSRVNFFLNKFKRLGFIEYDGVTPLKINGSTAGASAVLRTTEGAARAQLARAALYGAARFPAARRPGPWPAAAP